MPRQVREPRRTRRASDITGHENLLLLLPAPGDEIAVGGLIAELCARGRPPFVALLGDGAPDGSATGARAAETASRATLDRLGLPSERLLFVGLRQGRLPLPEAALFAPLKVAMTLLSRRNDCNVIGALSLDDSHDDPCGDRRAAWELARRIATENGLGLVGRVARDAGSDEASWDLDVAAWSALKTQVRQARGVGTNVSEHQHERYVRSL